MGTSMPRFHVQTNTPPSGRRWWRSSGAARPPAGRRPSASARTRGETSDAPPNLTGRDFGSALQNLPWPADVTGFGLPLGKACPSPVPGCLGGALVSWPMPASPDAALADPVLEGACGRLRPGGRPVAHSDRGCHHGRPGWVAICERNGLVRSMSAKGRAPDDSAMEGFFGRLRNEFFHGRDWWGVTRGELASMLDSYLRHHDDARPKESLGWRSPLQHGRSLGLAA